MAVAVMAVVVMEVVADAALMTTAAAVVPVQIPLLDRAKPQPEAAT